MYQIEHDENLKLARQIALVAHNGVMRGAEPYLNHPLRVSAACSFIWFDPYAEVGAILHDVIEDSEYDAGTLILLGIDPDVVDVVKLVTREQGVSRDDYVNAILASDNVHAIRVKLMDAIDNSTWSYLTYLEQGRDDWQQQRIYYRDLAYKLWSTYRAQFTDYHAPDEDIEFFDRVTSRWNELDAISQMLSRGIEVDQAVINLTMLDVIANTDYKQVYQYESDGNLTVTIE